MRRLSPIIPATLLLLPIICALLGAQSTTPPNSSTRRALSGEDLLRTSRGEQKVLLSPSVSATLCGAGLQAAFDRAHELPTQNGVNLRGMRTTEVSVYVEDVDPCDAWDCTTATLGLEEVQASCGPSSVDSYAISNERVEEAVAISPAPAAPSPSSAHHTALKFE